jgi:hypothetical protein
MQDVRAIESQGSLQRRFYGGQRGGWVLTHLFFPNSISRLPVPDVQFPV